MSLTQNQATKLVSIQTGLNEVVMAYNSLKDLADKVDRVGNDEELSLTATQVNALIGKYTALKTKLDEAVKGLPTL